MRVEEALKTVVIVCASGAVSSAFVIDAISEMLCRHKIRTRLIKCRLSEIDEYLSTADLFITSVRIEKELDKPVLPAAAFFTGIGMEGLESEIVRLLSA